MSSLLDREKTIEEIKAFLEKFYDRSGNRDSDAAKWLLAFPNHIGWQLNDNGKIVDVGVVPNHDDPNYIEALLERALDGDALAFDAVLIWAGWHLRENRKIPIDDVAIFAGRYLVGSFSRPPSRSGPKSHQLRHSLLRLAVKIVNEKGFLITNDDDKPNSACGIVAEAMLKLGKQPYSYDHIRRIWHSGPKLR